MRRAPTPAGDVSPDCARTAAAPTHPSPPAPEAVAEQAPAPEAVPEQAPAPVPSPAASSAEDSQDAQEDEQATHADMVHGFTQQAESLTRDAEAAMTRDAEAIKDQMEAVKAAEAKAKEREDALTKGLDPLEQEGSEASDPRSSKRRCCFSAARTSSMPTPPSSAASSTPLGSVSTASRSWSPSAPATFGFGIALSLFEIKQTLTHSLALFLVETKAFLSMVLQKQTLFRRNLVNLSFQK